MNLLGLMEDITSEIMLTTKRKAKECFTGQMAENMMVAGKMESNMESETTPRLVENLSKASGQRERDCIGYNPISENDGLNCRESNLIIISSTGIK